ncbi:MAG: hypothetical protein J1E04_05505 [Alistipes sp.]|nr:hypothetical protein [Alistipes sp.]
MKKHLLLAAAFLTAVSFIACDNETENGDNNNDNNNATLPSNVKSVKRLKHTYESFGHSTTNTFRFEYDSQNRISKAEWWGGDAEFAYNGKRLTITYPDYQGEGPVVMELNDDGFVTDFEYLYDVNENIVGNVHCSYNNGYFTSVSAGIGGDNGAILHFEWNDGLLTSVNNRRTLGNESDIPETEYTFVYDETAPDVTPINIDILHSFFDPTDFNEALPIGTFGFFGRQSRLYPVKVSRIWRRDGELDYESTQEIFCEFNPDGTPSKIEIVNGADDESFIYEFFY